jgi:sulfonate transport system substrate-binding protein
MMLLNRRHTLALFAAGAALGASGLARAEDDTKKLRIGWQKGGVLALTKANGGFEKRLADRGVAVEWNEFTSGPPLLEALGAGAIDFGSTGDVPPLFAQAAGGDLLYVAATKGAVDGSAILVKKDSPIQTLADLKGKKVAYKRGSSAHNFIVLALEKGGLGLGDVTSLDLSPSDAAAAFAGGQIDAWAIWDPFYAVAVQDPNVRVLTTTEGIVDAYGYYLANGAFTKQNPHIVADLIDVLAAIGKDAQAHLDDTATAISAVTGVPVPITKIVLTRKGADLGATRPLDDDILAYQQGLADRFFKLGIVPKQLEIKPAFWTLPTAL